MSGGKHSNMYTMPLRFCPVGHPTAEYLNHGFLYKGNLADHAIFTGLWGIVLQKTDIALSFTSNSFVQNSFEVRLTDSGKCQ